MKKLFFVFGFCLISTSLFGQSKTTKTHESCKKIDVPTTSVEKCTVTDLKTNVTREVTKTCHKQEFGASVKAGPLKAGLSGGAGICTTKEKVIETPKKK